LTGSHGVVAPRNFPPLEKKIAMSANGSVVTIPTKKLCRCSQRSTSSRRVMAKATQKPQSASSGMSVETEDKTRLSVQ
jgi:hypothetical protein